MRFVFHGQDWMLYGGCVQPLPVAAGVSDLSWLQTEEQGAGHGAYTTLHFRAFV